MMKNKTAKRKVIRLSGVLLLLLSLLFIGVAIVLAAAPYSINFAAADTRLNQGPYDPTYVKQTPASKSCPVTTGTNSGGPGRENNPYEHAVFADPDAPHADDSVESLTPEGMALGQIVVYEIEVVNNGDVSEPITMTLQWATEATSGPFGFDESYGIYCAFVDYGDLQTSEPITPDATVSWTWSLVDTDPDPETDDIEGIFTIEGLDPGETIIVEVWLVLEDELGGSTGNVQASLKDATTKTQGKITGGEQTVPLKQIGQFATQDADIMVTKSDDPDPVAASGLLTYTIIMTNLSTINPASNVTLTDTLDSSVGFVSISIDDTVGDTTTCTTPTVGTSGDVVCGPTILNPEEVVKITIVVDVPDATELCPDLVNFVEVTSDTNDSNQSNNTDTEITDVNCPTPVTMSSFNISASDNQARIMWETGTEIDNAGYNIYRSPTPAGPWSQINPEMIPAQGDAVSGGNYSFVDNPSQGVFYYRLEDISYNGSTTLHTPLKTMVGRVIRIPWFRPMPPSY